MGAAPVPPAGPQLAVGCLRGNPGAGCMELSTVLAPPPMAVPPACLARCAACCQALLPAPGAPGPAFVVRCFFLLECGAFVIGLCVRVCVYGGVRWWCEMVV